MLSGIVCLLYVYAVEAFNPTWGFVLGGLIGKPHVGITDAAINLKLKAYFNVDTPTVSMKTARTQIEEGSAVVDHHGDAEAEDSKCHFDDENFFNSNGRLIDKKSEVIDELMANNLMGARNLLGRALHTLQDFYSHSNWVELGQTEISQNLGITWPLEITPVAELGEIDTCTACSYTISRDIALKHAENCRTYDGLGTFLLNYMLDPMGTWNKVRVATCMLGIRPVGGGLESIVEWPNCQTPSNLIAPAGIPISHQLTSGWFGTEKALHSHRPKGKCSHGGPFDRDAEGLEGICKDTASHFLSPHYFLHEKAAALAQKATEKYLDELKDLLCTTGSGAVIAPVECVPLRQLYGVGPPLAFVIDTTGSMGTVIASVRSDAIAIVNSRRETDDAPGYYVLSQINDPAPPSAQVYPDPDSFITAISELGAFGGGDCPEYAMTGISNALDRISGGTIHLWTDAAAKDVELAQTITRRAFDQKVSVYCYLFNSGFCPTADGFSFVSAGTGGQFYAGLSPFEAGGTSKLAGALTVEDKIEIWAIAFGKVLGLKRQEAPRSLTYDIPVDSTMTMFTLSLSGISTTLDLFRPDGSAVDKADAGITLTTLTTGEVLTVDKPATGLWKVTVSGNSAFTLSVFGTSKLQFDKFDFVESAGARHDGYFPVETTPIPGSIIIGHAILDGGFASAEFELRSTTGDSLGKVDMTAGTGASDLEMPSNMFYGNVSIPNAAFNVYVSGKDSAGSPYQRVLPGILNPVPSNFTGPINSTKSTTTRTSSTTSLPTSLTNSTIMWPNSTTSGSSLSSLFTDLFSRTRSSTSKNSHTPCPSSSPSSTPPVATTAIGSSVVCQSCQPTPTEMGVTTLTQ